MSPQRRRPHTIQAILQEGFPEFERSRHLPAHQRRAARMLMACRTPTLGAHREFCPNGCFDETHFNSCRHRSCPLCGYIRAERWLCRASPKLFPCAHHHAVFTIPHELNPLWLTAPEVMMTLLFHAVRDTILTLLADPEHLGAKPGFLAVFQSWGRALTLHLHIHCVITAGGVDEAGRWRESESGYLLPGRVASELFKGKLLHSVRRAVQRGEIRLPPTLDHYQWRRLVAELYKKKWNVFIEGRIANPHFVMAYLGRYLRGGPIGNSRIVKATMRAITFRHARNKDTRSGKNGDGLMTLEAGEFMRRLLQHVPAIGSQCVRWYGVYSGSWTARSSGLPSGLEAGVVSADSPSGVSDSSSQVADGGRSSCPKCGGPLAVILYPKENLESKEARASPRDSACAA